MNITHCINERPLPISYPPVVRQESINYGYKDLASQAELINMIPEIDGWPELRAVLIDLNAPSGKYRTLGCEKSYSPFQSLEYPELNIKLVSYFDVAYKNMKANELQETFLAIVPDFWVYCQAQPDVLIFLMYDFEIRGVDYLEYGTAGWCMSPWIGGFGKDESEARSN